MFNEITDQVELDHYKDIFKEWKEDSPDLKERLDDVTDFLNESAKEDGC